MKLQLWMFTQVICTGTIKGGGSDQLHYKVNGHKLVIYGDNSATANVNENVTEITCTEPMFDFECKKESGNKLKK